MNDHRQQQIADYLRQHETQARIQAGIQQATSNMAVTISRAANLFDFSESQLREWEKRGLLQTERPLLSTDGKGATGHRQYSLHMVSKLAIIRDLINQGYSPGDIPLDIDKIWEEVARAGRATSIAPGEAEQTKGTALSIDARVESADALEFWRYFVTQTLRLSLLLICEDMPDTVAGLVLSLEEKNQAGLIIKTDELKNVGRSLVGWLGQNGSFYLFLTEEPTFDFPTDYRLQTLKLPDEESPTGDRVLDNAFLILERGARRSTSLVPNLRETVKRLLDLIYERRSNWEFALTHSTQSWLYQAHDLERASHVAGDRIFNSLLERVIDLGGKNAEGQERWRFCALLLPDDINQPAQQQSLVVRAQTRRSPYQIGVTRIHSQDADQVNSITLKAFEGSQIVTMSAVLPGDSMLNPSRLRVITSTPEMIARGRAGEGFQRPVLGEPLHSALAVPVIGEHGVSIAVFYIEADETDAFAPGDLLVLRLISRMLEELLMTSATRNERLVRRENLLQHPAVVDSTFDTFAVEADFISEIDCLLDRIQKKRAARHLENETISILAVDIDNQSSIAMKYGNRIARNLSQQVGLRIIGNLTISDVKVSNFKLFHVSADRYYILLEGLDLPEARAMARQLHQVLRAGDYRIQPLSATSGKAVISPTSMLELSGITVHLGVSTYTFEKLDELLQRYPSQSAPIYVRTLVLAGMDTKLERGKLEGGNCIVSWDRDTWSYIVLPS